MKIKALTSFAGKISMYAGEVREVFDKELAKDLIRAGHAIEAKSEEKKASVEKPVEKSEAPEEKPVENTDEAKSEEKKAKATK